MKDQPERPALLRRRQVLTLALMIVGYTGYYACRSNFSVSLPLLLADMTAQGWDANAARSALGQVASVGVLAYALGKFASGTWTDFAGGRRVFLGGMVLSAVCTLAFAASGTLPMFTLVWAANRLAQSGGWVGMVKMTSRWFGYSQYARAMALVSLSFLFGDALVRWVMGLALSAGAGWRSLFVGAALALASIAVVSARVLRESPSECGLPELPSHTDNLFRTSEGDRHRPESVAALWRTLAASPAFLTICAVSLVMTLLRETFNTWTPTYFVEAIGMSAAEAARSSALFPLSGGVAVLAAGWLGDRLGRRGRSVVLVWGLALSALGLFALSLPGARPGVAVVLVGLVGFLLLAPYSYLAGAISLDFGGKQASATACGVIDGVGYLGGILAGGGIARVAGALGWEGAFAALGASAALGAGIAFQYARLVGRETTPA